MWRSANKKQELDRLVVAHLPRALRLATRLTGDAESAEEVVQEALLRAARHWESFRGRAHFQTWFYRIVVNTFRDHSRGRRCAQPLPKDAPDLKAAGPAEESAAKELGELIAQHVSALPERQREVLVLISYEGLTAREVSELLNITEANVYATLYAARSRLKKDLAPYLSNT